MNGVNNTNSSGESTAIKTLSVDEITALVGFYDQFISFKETMESNKNFTLRLLRQLYNSSTFNTEQLVNISFNFRYATLLLNFSKRKILNEVSESGERTKIETSVGKLQNVCQIMMNCISNVFRDEPARQGSTHIQFNFNIGGNGFKRSKLG
ncbi:MAG: hypothetical protein KIT27_07135 [Legionellales bacterium]|nr:hypothetical protein [Legionellales bacterium]